MLRRALLISLFALAALPATAAAAAPDLGLSATTAAGAPVGLDSVETIASDADTRVVERVVTIANNGSDPVTGTFGIEWSPMFAAGTLECRYPGDAAYAACPYVGPGYDLRTLAPGASIQVHFAYPVGASFPEEPSGTIKVIVGADASPADNVATTTWQYRWRHPSAGVGAQGSQQPVKPGKPFTFTVPVYNIGTDPFRFPADVVVGGEYGLKVLSASLPGTTCGATAGGFACPVAALAASETRPLTVTAVTDRGGYIGLGLVLQGRSEDAIRISYPTDSRDDIRQQYLFCIPVVELESGYTCNGGSQRVTQLRLPLKLLRVKRGAVELPVRCYGRDGCPAMRLRFVGKVKGAKVAFAARTPALTQAARSVKVKPPAKALKALRRAGQRPVKLTVTGPDGFHRKTVSLRAR